MTLQKLMLKMVGIAGLIGAGVLGWMTWNGVREVNTRFENQVAEYGEQYSKYRGAILKDLDSATELKEFDRSGKDAGPYLNPLVFWSREQPGTLAPIPDSVRDAAGELLSFVGTDLLLEKQKAHSPVSELSSMDFSWMSRLGEFQYWDLERNSPREAYYESEGIISLPPTPRIIESMYWGKARLYAALYETNPNRIAAALLETASFGRLLITTEHATSLMVGMTLLELTRDLQEHLLKNGKLPRGSAISLDQHSFETEKRLANTAGSLFVPFHEISNLKEIRTHAREKFGTCAGLREVTDMILAHPSWYRGRYTQQVSLINEMITENGCHFPKAAALISDTEYEQRVWKFLRDDQSVNSWSVPKLRYLPKALFSDMVGKIMLSFFRRSRIQHVYAVSTH